jgi:ATP-dependent RNA helicase RhlE
MPLPEDFAKEAAKLPKPIVTAERPAHPQGQRRGGQGARAEEERPRRRFTTRKPSGVGAHKGAVRASGGQRGKPAR